MRICGLRKHRPQGKSSNLAGVQLFAGNAEDTSAWLPDLAALSVRAAGEYQVVSLLAEL
jgi:hypothetical protein